MGYNFLTYDQDHQSLLPGSLHDWVDDDVRNVVSAIVLHELFTGALEADQPESILEITHEMAALPVAPFAADAPEEAAAIRLC